MPRSLNPNMMSAGDEAIRALVFVVGSVRAAEQPPRHPVEPRSVTDSPPPEVPSVTAEPTSSLPPEYVCQRESHCTYGIVSTSLGCTGYPCFGMWQFDPRTWTNGARALGFPTLFDATPTDPFAVYHPERWAQVTPAMEDAVAAHVWNGGQGCSAWGACS